MRILTVTPDLVPALSELMALTFTETFGYLFSAADLHAFFTENYHPDVLMVEADKSGQFWRIVLDQDDQAVAYLQVTPVHLPYPDIDLGLDGEIKRLYIRRSYQGRGLGKTLMGMAVEHLDQRFSTGAHWISVWSGNKVALNLYASWGFEKVGEYGFNVGSTPNLMFVLRRASSEGM
jgi:ribosomal protein S18 acetylase RimI-like enzyme